MTEVLGTAIGVVSLGIQICDSITEYIHDFNTRDEQLGNVLRRAQHVKQLLDVLERLARDLASSQPEASHVLATQIVSCARELETLRDFVRGLAPTARPVDDLREKMRERAKKLTFPFSRADIEKLELRLEKASQTLSLAVDCLQLQSQAAMQNNLDQLSRRLEDMHLMMQSWDSMRVRKPGGKVVALALADPSALRQVCDVVKDNNGSALSNDRSTDTREYSSRRPRRSCGCRPRRLRSSHTSPWWFSISVFREIVEERIHEPGCPYSQLDPAETSRSVALTYTGLQGYLSMAISIGLLTRHGAGGCSISPVLQYRRALQPGPAPAFALTNALAEAFSYCTFQSVTEPLIDAALEALRQLYANKQALPTDVDHLGATVLTWFCYRVFWLMNAGYYIGVPQDTQKKMLRAKALQLQGARRRDDFRLLWKVIDGMLALGIPTQGVGSEPEALPAIDYILSFSISWQGGVSVDELSKFAMFSDQDLVIRPHCYYAIHPLYQIAPSVEAREHLMPVYGLDSDLTLALIRQDETELEKVLRRGQKAPLVFKEGSHGSLEFAIQWPRGLQMVLQQRSATDIDSYLSDGAAVRMAMSIGLAKCGHSPIDPPTEMCEPECECSTSLGLLLDAGCHIAMARVNWGYSTLRCIHVLLSHIKCGRDALKDLARSTLPLDFQVRLNLDADTVLDNHAGDVTRVLQNHGINPAERLGLPRHDIRLKDPQHFGKDSVYHWIDTILSAKIAHGLGFEDFDGVNGQGLTPLAKQSEVTDVNGKWNVEPAYLVWLVERGASLERMRSHFDQTHRQPPVHTIAHRIMAKAAKRTVKGKYYMTDWIPLLNYTSQMTVCDGCECGCSEPGAGCSALSVFLRQIVNTCIVYSGWTELEIVTALVKVFADQEALTKAMAKPLIRLLAFQALGIRHTCCNESILEACPPAVDEEDYAELRGEDATLLRRLEAAVSELNASFERSGLSLFTFLHAEGMKYLQNVADEGQGSALTEEERNGIEGVGVRLEPARARIEKTTKTYRQWRLTESDPQDWTELYWDRERERIEMIGSRIWFNDDGTFRPLHS